MLKQFIAVCFFILFVQNILGQELVTDRPDQTESSVTIPKGSLQIESGFLLGFTEENRFSTRDLLLSTNLFRIGLTHNVELRMVSQVEEIKTEFEKSAGINDLEVGAKWKFFVSKNSGSKIAFLSHLVIPTGSQTLSNHSFATINKLAFSHLLSKSSSIGYNLGYNYFGKGNGDLIYSVSFGYSLSSKAAIFIEPYGEVSDFSQFVLNADAGFTYLIGPNLQADFSFGSGLNNKMNYISMGISWRILPD